MKKQALIVVLLGMIFLSENSFGQTIELVSVSSKNEKATPKTYLDLVLNLVGTNFNYGNQNSDLKNYKKSAFGAQIGVSFQAGITPHFSLISEIYFMMKGGSLSANNPFTTNKTTLRLYSFELPLLARFHFGRIHVNAGPSLAYNFYGSNKIESTTSDLSFGNAIDGFKHWEAGAQAGGGYTFHTKRKTVRVDARYNYGITNIANRGEIYNRSFIISLHFSKAWKTNPLAKNY